MSGFGIIMLIFGTGIIAAGLYIYTGHNSELLLWRAHLKNPSKRYLRYLGRVTMLVGLSPIITSIVTLFFDEESPIPIIFLFVSMILFMVYAAMTYKNYMDNKPNEGNTNKE